MISASSRPGAMPLVLRLAVVGAVAAGALGALSGLILGLRAYPRTAWFAVLEVGAPAALAGGTVGACVGLVVVVLRKIIRS